MIAADRIVFNDDGTAWCIWKANEAFDGETGEDYIHSLDRPCDACGGTALGLWDLRHAQDPCPDCIDGRHTFDIEAPCQDDGCSGTSLYRVSVVPGMVLPLVAIDEHNIVGRYIVQTQPSARWWGIDNSTFPIQRIGSDDDITLPSAAAPGVWAVKLRVPS